MSGFSSLTFYAIDYPQEAGASAFVYQMGTLTQVQCYSDSFGLHPVSQPIIGTWSGELNVWVANNQMIDIQWIGGPKFVGVVIPPPVTPLSSSSVVSDSSMIDLCLASGATPASAATVTFVSGQNAATLASGTIPASGSIIANSVNGYYLPQGTTYTLSGSTLTLSNPASLSGTSVPCYAGMDCTTILQTAVNTLGQNGQGGKAVFSKPGVYLLNGAAQTVTVASSSYVTTLNGSQTFPLATVAVNSIPSISGQVQASQGKLQIAGVAGLVSYTGISGNTFTGCTGGTGTAAANAAVALAYQTNAQVLFPAVNYQFVVNVPVEVCGREFPSTGIWQTGFPAGATLLSSCNGCYMFDMIPAQSQWGWIWTGVMPVFRDIVWVTPYGGVGGGANMINALRSKVHRVSVNALGDFVTPTGTLHAFISPHGQNNGDVTYHDVSIRAMPYGVQLSEHVEMTGNLEFVQLLAAITAGQGGHLNSIGHLDVEQCGAVFLASGTITLAGIIDTECVASPTTMLVQGDGGIGYINGKIGIHFASGGTIGSYPTVSGYGMGLNVELLSGNYALVKGSGWKCSHPDETFLRNKNFTTSGDAGMAYPSMHPWRTIAGTCQITSTSGNAYGTLARTSAGSCQFGLPVLDSDMGGRSRTVTYTFLSGGSSSAATLAPHWVNNGSNAGKFIGLSIGGLYGTPNVGGTTYASQAFGPFSNSVENVVAIAITIGPAGLPTRARYYFNGTLSADVWLTAAQQALFATVLPTSGTGFAFEDDILISSADPGTTFQGVQVTPLSEDDLSQTTILQLTGTSAGNARSSQPFQGPSYKKFVVQLTGYENTTATAQTITYPTAFTVSPRIVADDSGGATVSTTTLTLPASMSSTKTGWIIVEGY